MAVYPYLEKTAINPAAPITIARSASFSVYDLGDTGYLTPLNVTRLSDGATVTTLLSDTNGYLPDFTVIDRTSVVIKSGTFIKTLVTSVPVPGAAGAPGDKGDKGDKGDPGDVPTWKANTFYPLNMAVVNPAGDLMVVTTAHTSTSTYDPTKFTLANKATDTDVAAAITQAATKAALDAAYAPITNNTSKLDVTAAASKYSPMLDAYTLNQLERQGVQQTRRLGGLAMVDYMDATEIDEGWANLTASDASTGVTVSGSKLYGSSASSLALRWFPVAVGAKARATGAFMYVSGASGTNAFYAGYEMLTQGAAPASGTPTGIGIGHQNGVAKGFKGSSIPAGAGTEAPASFTLTSGKVYEWSVVVDETNVTLAMREQGSSVNFISWMANRASLTAAGFNLNRIFIYVQDARGSAGASYAFPYAATLSNQPPRTKVLTYGIMGSNHKDVLTTSASGDKWHIQLPVSYDPRSPAPLCIYTHQAQTGNAEHPFTDSRETPLVKALGDAGFIFASADDGGDRWGNQTSLDAYLALYQYVQSHWAVGPVVLLGVSMGGMPMLNLLQQRKLPNVAAAAGISPVCDLDVLYANATYTATIRTDYGVASDGSDYATKTAAYNPMKANGQAFRGIPMRFYTGTADLTVPANTNAVPFLAKVAPYTVEASNVVTAGGHIDPSQYQAADLVSFYKKYV